MPPPDDTLRKVCTRLLSAMICDRGLSEFYDSNLPAFDVDHDHDHHHDHDDHDQDRPSLRSSGEHRIEWTGIHAEYQGIMEGYLAGVGREMGWDDEGEFFGALRSSLEGEEEEGEGEEEE